jgi:hypothetical protein
MLQLQGGAHKMTKDQTSHRINSTGNFFYLYYIALHALFLQDPTLMGESSKIELEWQTSKLMESQQCYSYKGWAHKMSDDVYPVKSTIDRL